jgi:hypothetical protein
MWLIFFVHRVCGNKRALPQNNQKRQPEAAGGNNEGNKAFPEFTGDSREYS